MAAGSPGDRHRLGDAIEPIDENNHVRRLRGGACAARAHGHADIRRRESRRVIDAVANHQSRGEPPFRDDSVDLVGRNAVGEHRVEIEGRADRFGRFGAIARHHDNFRDAGPPQSLNRPRRFATQFVGEQQHCDDTTVHGHEHRQRRPPGRTPRRPSRPFLQSPFAMDELEGADADSSPLYDALQSGAQNLANIFGHLQREALAPCGGDDRRRQDMMRRLFERGREPQSFVGRHARSGLDGDEACAADRQSAGLVEHHGVDARERLQRAPALDQYAAASGLRGSSDKSRRRREDQGTGRRRHEHRERSNRIARKPPGGASDAKRDRQKQKRVTIRHANKRGLGGLRRRDHSNDACIGAVAGRRGRLHLKGLADVDRAAADGFARAPHDWNGLARQRRLVDHGAGADDLTVDRNDLAGAHQYCVPDRDLVDRHIFDECRRSCGARGAARDR